MRIIAGNARGRRLDVPRGDRTRPTGDRVREALFSSLQARGAVTGARVLDLFAGSGALGLEAVSRGAASAVLVDSAREAVEVIRRNLRVTDLTGITVVHSTVERFLRRPEPEEPFDLLFCDPPYALSEDELARVLTVVEQTGWMAPGGLLVVEREARSPEPGWPQGLIRDPVRRFGGTALWSASVPEAG